MINKVAPMSESVYSSVTPDGDSADERPVFACPSCNAEELRQLEVYEHTTCGYVGFKESYVQESECPKCGHEVDVGSGAVLAVGSVFRCSSCTETFDCRYRLQSAEGGDDINDGVG